MWRAFFVALGIAFCIVGGECLLIEKAVLAKGAEEVVDPNLTGQNTNGVVKPPEWAPWSLLSVGAVTLLYSFTIPRRVAS